jgi:hypothetical protein
MGIVNKYTTQFDWLTTTLSFFRKHFTVIITLGLIAGLGRVIQLKGFGPISPTANLVLEIIIESARILLFVYVVGSANIAAGFRRIVRGFAIKSTSRNELSHALRHLKTRWKELLLNLIAYLTIAWLLNLFIDHLAYETCLYLTMKQNGVLSETSSEWTIILFFKNLTVIPLTLILNATFLFFITGKLRALGHETPSSL